MAVNSERALHTEIMLRLKAWPVIAIPVPNGIWMPVKTPAERSMAARIIHMMKQSGQLVPGAPDLLVLWNGGCAMLELKRAPRKTLLAKTTGGRASGAQIEMQSRAIALGINFEFCDTWEAVRSCLLRCGCPRPIHDHRSAADV